MSSPSSKITHTAAFAGDHHAAQTGEVVRHVAAIPTPDPGSLVTSTEAVQDSLTPTDDARWREDIIHSCRELDHRP